MAADRGRAGFSDIGDRAGPVLVLLIRSGVLCGLQKRLTGQVRHRPLLSVISELLQPLHFLHATLQRTIRWRTRVYRVHDNDDFVSVPGK